MEKSVLLLFLTFCFCNAFDRQSDFNRILRPSALLMRQDDQCDVTAYSRQDCDAPDQASCKNQGCCWSPVMARASSLPWCFYPKGRCTMVNIKRIDCHPEPGSSEQNCKARGCCWRRAPQGMPWCYYAVDDEAGYSASEPSITATGFTSQLTMKKASHWPRNVASVTLDVRMETRSRLHFKLTDTDNNRWEVPLTTLPNVTAKVDNTDYVFNYTRDPFSLIISRKASGEVLFDTRGTQLVYSDQFLELTTKLPTEFLYGLGEHRGSFLKNVKDGQKLSFWARDMAPRENFNLYGVHPFYLSIGKDGTAHGVFLLNSNAMDVILAPDGTLTYRTIGGVLDFYLFTGPTPLDVVQQYSEVIGRSAMPPFWSLGFHLCRWGYMNDQHMREIVNRMVEADMPYDTQWNDIDYMNQKYDFTVDQQNFKDLPKLIDDLHRIGKKYMMILDAGIPNVAGYKPYKDGMDMNVFMLKADGSGPIIGKVWPGTTAFPDFSHPNSSDYWYKQCKYLRDIIAFDGIWIDMNEPSNFFAGSEEGCPGNSTLDTPPYLPGYVPLMMKTLCPSARHFLGPHYDLHSLYGYGETVATNLALKRLIPGKRPFIISRSSFAGSGHYGFHWLGDNRADWANLKYSIAGIMNNNIYGLAMVGADICGFMGTTNEELCVRWMQLGAFYPFMRNHNTLGAPDQDPANPAFSLNGRNLMKYALKLRYSLLPHLYTLLYRSHTDGSPVTRPLMFLYPLDADTYYIDGQFMWGDSLLISPVLDTDMVIVLAYIPEDVWYDFYTGEKLILYGSVILDAPLDKINVHIRGGSIVPTQQSGNSTKFSRQTPFTLTVALPAAGRNATGELFWDDGESESATGDLTGNLLKFSAQQSSSQQGFLTVNHAAMPYRTSMQLSLIRVMGVPKKPAQVTVNGAGASFVWDSYNTLQIHSLVVDMYTTEVHVQWT